MYIFQLTLYSKRAERDVECNVIDQTYAKKVEVPELDDALSTSTTTAVTPHAVKEAVEEVDVIPALPEGPASLYSEAAGFMMWGGWELENIDVPETTITIAGQEYKIVQIGNQMWMAENLNYLDNLSFPHTANPQHASAAYPLYVGEYINRFNGDVTVFSGESSVLLSSTKSGNWYFYHCIMGHSYTAIDVNIYAGGGIAEAYPVRLVKDL